MLTTDAPPGFSTTRQCWTYTDVEAAPLTGLEDYLLRPLRKLTCRLDVAGVCDAILTGIEATFGATSSWIILYDEQRKLLVTWSFRGVAAEIYSRAEFPIVPGTVSGEVFLNRQIIFVPDVQRETRWFNRARVHASGLKSVFNAPLMMDDKPIGLLGMDSPRFREVHPPDMQAVKQFELFAAQAAIGLTNARLYEKSEEDRARLRALLRETRTLRGNLSQLKAEMRQSGGSDGMIGISAGLQRVFHDIAQVAASDVTVLLLGETGTGKELAARALHQHSRRAARPFVAVNCAALPEQLIESEMFGYERGAFTGANARKAGKFELADHGTLFLDEIGDLPAAAQAKLLRALQEGRVQRIGSTHDITVDVRLIAATNQDLSARVAGNTFREDLYYRLNVFPITLPPLRERREDIPMLAKHCALRLAERIGKRIEGIEEAALDKLTSYRWPGNIRELQNVVERAVILATGGVITADTVRLEEQPPGSSPVQARVEPSRDIAPPANGVRSLMDVERAAIAEAIRAAQGRISGARGAAALLGLKPTTLHAKMKKLGVRREDVLVDRH